jgi:histidinol dehydrogenase
MLVRAANIPEYVQDGVVDCGIQVRISSARAGAEVDELLIRSASRRCTLEAAVPTESSALGLIRSRRAPRGRRFYPLLRRRGAPALRGTSTVELVRVTGSVEVAPRLGLADADRRLVSSGSTLAHERLRSLGSLFSSEAVLVARARRRTAARARRVLRSVVDARETRYLMLNAPEERCRRSRARARVGLAERPPAGRAGHGRRARARPAADVWRLLPRLEAAGGSSILLVPSSGWCPDVTDVATVLDGRPARGDVPCASGRSRSTASSPSARPADGAAGGRVLALADSVRRWHELQRPPDVRLEVRPGVELERRWAPLASVGIYVPRRLVSTLVMCAVPALVAGVERIAVATPPDGAGLVAAAARLLGIEEVWALGGPPAIAAFAYGTDSIQRVDKICGPGGSYVNEAKLLVSRDVAIDLPAGRPRSSSSQGTAPMRGSPRSSLPRRASTGLIPVCRLVSVDGDLGGAREVDALAPEHLVVLGDDAEELAGASGNAGAIFVGDGRRSRRATTRRAATTCSRPAAGRARSAGIGLETFLKPVTIQRLTRDGLAALRPTVEALAAVEGMPAHAAAVRR